MNKTAKNMIITLGTISILSYGCVAARNKFRSVKSAKILKSLPEYKSNKKPIDFTEGVNHYFDKKGNLLRLENNSENKDKFYVNNSKLDLNNDELGYLIRAVYGEAGNINKKGTAISYNAKVGVAEVLKNRVNDKTPNSEKYSWNRYFANYNTYKDVIEKTGIDAIKGTAYKSPYTIYSQQIAYRKRFLETVKACIYVYYNTSNITDNSLYFYTPALASLNPKGFIAADVKDVDNYYEFTFLKPIS